jgi:hypothetical protein
MDSGTERRTAKRRNGAASGSSSGRVLSVGRDTMVGMLPLMSVLHMYSFWLMPAVHLRVRLVGAFQ